VVAAADTLAVTYSKLTQSNDAWTAFKTDLDAPVNSPGDCLLNIF
jgi:hypothetical protein